MNIPERAETRILPVKSDSNLKEYFCPHCQASLFKGNIKKLNMVCHHCQTLIRADEKDLVKHNPDIA